MKFLTLLHFVVVSAVQIFFLIVGLQLFSRAVFETPFAFVLLPVILFIIFFINVNCIAIKFYNNKFKLFNGLYFINIDNDDIIGIYNVCYIHLLKKRKDAFYIRTKKRFHKFIIVSCFSETCIAKINELKRLKE